MREGTQNPCLNVLVAPYHQGDSQGFGPQGSQAMVVHFEGGVSQPAHVEGGRHRTTQLASMEVELSGSDPSGPLVCIWRREEDGGWGQLKWAWFKDSDCTLLLIIPQSKMLMCWFKLEEIAFFGFILFSLSYLLTYKLSQGVSA